MKMVTTTTATISSFESKYMAYLRSTHSASYVRDNDIAFKWLKNNLGDIDLTEMKTIVLEQLFASEFGRANHNALRFYRTLKAAFGKAVAWNEIHENPFAKFKLPKIPETLIPFLKRGDLDKLLAQNIAPDLKLLFEFAFYTGMRQAEILNLEWTSVEMNERVIRVSNTDTFTTKSKRERTIPINDKLLSIISEVRLTSGNFPGERYMFQRKGKKINGNHVSRKFKAAVRAAGLSERLHFHCLRHSFASNLIRAGVNPVHVQKLLGHQNLSTTLRYITVGIDDLRGAVAKLD
jgi:site-specific recombinase XerD